MKSRYKGSHKTNKLLIKRLFIVGILLSIFIISTKYVNLDNSEVQTEITNIMIKN